MPDRRVLLAALVLPVAAMRSCNCNRGTPLPPPTPATAPAAASAHAAVEQQVFGIVSEQMGVDRGELHGETRFVEDLGADSLDTVELVMEFEDRFGLSIPDEDAEKIRTVGQAVDYVRRHTPPAPGGR